MARTDQGRRAREGVADPGRCNNPVIVPEESTAGVIARALGQPGTRAPAASLTPLPGLATSRANLTYHGFTSLKPPQNGRDHDAKSWEVRWPTRRNGAYAEILPAGVSPSTAAGVGLLAGGTVGPLGGGIGLLCAAEAAGLAVGLIEAALTEQRSGCLGRRLQGEWSAPEDGACRASGRAAGGGAARASGRRACCGGSGRTRQA